MTTADDPIFLSVSSFVPASSRCYRVLGTVNLYQEDGRMFSLYLLQGRRELPVHEATVLQGPRQGPQWSPP